MTVRAIPLGWFLNGLLGLVTFGVGPLAIYLTMRSWPKRLDERGLETRAGRRFAWSDFTKVVRVVTQAGAVTTERYDLRSPRGTVAVVPNRLYDGDAVLNYALARVPQLALRAN